MMGCGYLRQGMGCVLCMLCHGVMHEKHKYIMNIMNTKRIDTPHASWSHVHKHEHPHVHTQIPHPYNRYEIDKLTASQRLDLNLEKGRMRDELQAVRDKANEMVCVGMIVLCMLCMGVLCMLCMLCMTALYPVYNNKLVTAMLTPSSCQHMPAPTHNHITNAKPNRK